MEAQESHEVDAGGVPPAARSMVTPVKAEGPWGHPRQGTHEPRRPHRRGVCILTVWSTAPGNVSSTRGQRVTGLEFEFDLAAKIGNSEFVRL